MSNDLEIYESGISCGVRSLTGVASGNLDSFKCIVAQKTYARGDCGYFEKGYVYIFSDNSSGGGKKLAALIERSGLGAIQSSPWRVNPNSGNNIKVWTWRYNGRVPAAWKKLKWPQDDSSDWRNW